MASAAERKRRDTRLQPTSHFNGEPSPGHEQAGGRARRWQRRFWTMSNRALELEVQRELNLARSGACNGLSKTRYRHRA